MGNPISKEDLAGVDEKIKIIVTEVSLLPFVKQTHFSCQGHPDLNRPAFMDIEYNEEPRFHGLVDSFKRDIQGIYGFAGQFDRILKDRIFHYVYNWQSEDQVIKGWSDFMNVVMKYKRI